MIKKRQIYYWLCQLLGWGAWCALVFYLFIQQSEYKKDGRKEFIYSLLFFMFCSILFTHILRFIIKKTGWLHFSFGKVTLLFILSVSIFSIATHYTNGVLEDVIPGSFSTFVKDKKLKKASSMEIAAGLDSFAYYKDKAFIKDSVQLMAISEIKTKTNWHRDSKGNWVFDDGNSFIGVIQNIILISIWLLFYLVYHYVERNRFNELGRLRMQSNIKELELKTIKAHINPHFIFNSLNSIRALVDENPTRARTAITELSNILRSSMQAEKQETVTLEKELNIVNDYLALEQIRFEERLKVELEIDEDTLEHPVPPMMLQTLVENAVKHGISKLIAGGSVRIITDFVGDHLELIVENSGQLTESDGTGGFGIKSTQDRLNLMYRGKANFTIRNKDHETVESKVTIPVNI